MGEKKQKVCTAEKQRKSVEGSTGTREDERKRERERERERERKKGRKRNSFFAFFF